MAQDRSHAPSQLNPPAPYQNPVRWSRYPLTVFDNSLERSTFLTGWLVKGTVDAHVLASALGRVTRKWRVLAGRVESIPGTRNWQLAVPLGPLPPTYHTFALTESISDVPLSSYISLPLPANSPSLPQSLFLDPTTPRQNADYASLDHPLTSWHVTHFPSRSAVEPAYSCIGFGRGHGVIDGIGAASILRALVAEMRGLDWEVPPLPSEGEHPNPITKVLARKAEEGDVSHLRASVGYSTLGVKGVLWLAGWHLRERYWRGSVHRILIFPKECISSLVEGVRAQVRRTTPEMEISTGDTLVAWAIKVIYERGSPPDLVVHCSNFANFRDLITQAGGDGMSFYPHNAFLPLSYPTLTVSAINATSLADLTRTLASVRHALTIEHVVAAYQLMSGAAINMPVHPEAQDTLVVSNVSASRILEADWSPIGSEGTVCSYRFSATTSNLVIGNTLYIAGRLADGSTVLDVNLNKARMQNLVSAIEALKSA